MATVTQGGLSCAKSAPVHSSLAINGHAKQLNVTRQPLPFAFDEETHGGAALCQATMDEGRNGAFLLSGAAMSFEKMDRNRVGSSLKE
ncbi:hypothetical protein PIB30_018914 [Stylosanthes scabra]|uniref:Uncharacterized protein n=1 Tax=Stylosanthes scabra TaxID=79078 RepID=A0ABU6X9K1_9FABA|nr:hypothetical protein [Stylosanthes scabra]